LLEFGGEFEFPQRVVPHLFEDAGGGSEGFAVGAVITIALFNAGFDEAGVKERSELERDGSEGNVGHGSMDGSRGLFLMPDEPEDFTAPG
jgi:hypothetical protein